MAVRTRDWLKFGALVALAFVFGLAFASTLDLPRKGGATPLIPEAQAAGGTAFQIPAAKPAAEQKDNVVDADYEIVDDDKKK